LCPGQSNICRCCSNSITVLWNKHPESSGSKWNGNFIFGHVFVSSRSVWVWRKIAIISDMPGIL